MHIRRRSEAQFTKIKRKNTIPWIWRNVLIVLLDNLQRTTWWWHEDGLICKKKGIEKQLFIILHMVRSFAYTTSNKVVIPTMLFIMTPQKMIRMNQISWFLGSLSLRFMQSKFSHTMREWENDRNKETYDQNLGIDFLINFNIPCLRVISWTDKSYCTNWYKKNTIKAT